jgi:hypothetical protein
MKTWKLWLEAVLPKRKIGSDSVARSGVRRDPAAFETWMAGYRERLPNGGRDERQGPARLPEDPERK